MARHTETGPAGPGAAPGRRWPSLEMFAFASGAGAAPQRSAFGGSSQRWRTMQARLPFERALRSVGAGDMYGVRLALGPCATRRAAGALAGLAATWICSTVSRRAVSSPRSRG
jgi:hypothetical protein